MPDSLDFSALHQEAAPSSPSLDFSALHPASLDFSALGPQPEPSSTLGGVAKETAQLPTQIGGGLVHAAGTMGEAAGTGIKELPEGAKQTVGNYVDIMDQIDAGQSAQVRRTTGAPPEGIDFQGQFAQTYAAADPDQRAAIRKSIEGAQAGMPATEQEFAEAGETVKGAGAKVAQAGTAIQQFGESTVGLTDEEKQRFWVKSVNMLGNLVTYVGAGAAGGLPAVIGLAGVQGFGDTYDAAKQNGADDQKAAAAGLFGGLANAGLMTVPVSKALDVMEMLPGALRGEYMKAATEMVKSGATITAFSQLNALSDNVIARSTYDPDRPLTQGIGENIPETFLAGAVVPMIGAGIGAAARRVLPQHPAPEQTGERVMQTGDLDDAIDTAKGAVDQAGDAYDYDIEKMGAEAANPPENLDRFGGLNTGTIEQDENGGYQFRAPTGDAIPLVPWEPEHGPVGDEDVISPALAAAQRQHYEGMGVHVVYFQNDPTIPFDGAVDPGQPDTIFLSNNPTRNAAQIGAHEITHVLESTELPDGTNLGDLLHEQIKQGVTDEGWRHANELFGGTVPDRGAFPEGPEGDSYHADAVANHLITELGADIGSEAPRFDTFAGRVVEAVQNRFGPVVAKDVLGRFITGIRTAMDTVRKFFGTDDPEAATMSQNWVTNLDQVHDTLAQMYAAKYGTQLEKEQAVIEGMRRQAQQPPEAAPLNFDDLHPPPPETAPEEPPEGGAQFSPRKEQTETPEFRNWFGASKTVEHDGTPTVFYHGSNADIESFQAGRSRFGNEGFYFTKAAGLANIYAESRAKNLGGEANVSPVYLRINNPKIIDNPLWEKVKAFFSKTAPERTAFAKSKEGTSSMALFKKDIDALKAQGYDGIVNKLHNEVVVFDPQQIKSAIGNRGTFDAANPDIRMSPRDRRFMGGGDVDKSKPEDIAYRDEVSNLIGAATGKTGEQGQPESRGGRGGTSGPTISERDYNNLVGKGLRQVKNASAFERNTFFGWLFPRTLAELDDLSAEFWRPWEAREDKSRANAEDLKRIISPSLTDLPQESRDRVYAALELARKWNWRPPDDGTQVRVKNTSFWQAQKSKPGDNYILSPKETRAFQDTMKLGDEGWRMFMRALADREGWTGSLDPEAIRTKANGDRRLLRLADALGQAKLALDRPYFPAARHGDYFVAVYPKAGTDTESLGGYPKVEWFQTIEDTSLREVMGKPRKTAADVGGVKDAIANLKTLTKPDGSLAFPEDQYRIEVGDLRTRPDALRRLDIPAIEKLFMLMERKTTQSMIDKIIADGSTDEGLSPKEIAGLKKGAAVYDKEGRLVGGEAYERYHALFGETKEALLDAVYQDLLAGFKKPANLTPGYDADFDRAIAGHIQQVGRNAADMQYRPQIDQAYDAIQDNHPHAGTREYWRDWRRYQEDPTDFLSRAAGGINQYGAAYVMAMNPATTSSIMFHTPLMAAPVLSVGGGMGQASAQITRGLREAYANIKFGKDGAYINTAALGRTAAEKAFLAELNKVGLLHSLGADDLRSVSETQGGLFGENAPIVRRGLNIAMSNISVADQANRSAIALAAFRMAQSPDRLAKMAGPWMEHNALFREMVTKEGLTPENFGRFMLSEAAGSWGKMNQAPAMRGAEGHLLFAMHGFQTRFLSTAFKLAKNMGPEGKMAATWMGAGLFAATGLYGLPFTQDLENVATAVWKTITGEDPMIDANVRAFFNDTGFGKIGTEIMMRGPASSLLGTDLSSRIGFGSIISDDLSASDLVGTIPSILFSRLAAAWNREQSGQGATAAAVEFLPNALRAPAKAYIDTQQGVMSRGGKMEQPAGNLTAGDIAMQAAGFVPLKQEQAFARNDYLSRLQGRDLELHQRIVSTVANLAVEAQEASQKGDDQRAAALTVQVEGMIGDYNKAHYQTPVTGEELGDALLQRKNPELYKRMKLPELLQPEAARNPYP